MNDFENIIKFFVDPNTLYHSKSISEKRIKILQLDKEKDLIKAEIQGNEIIPYKLDIDLTDISESSFLNIIRHNCPDFIEQKGINNKFCTHIAKIFDILYRLDSEFAYELLKKLYIKVNNRSLNPGSTTSDIDFFVNKDIENRLDFEYKGFNFFLEQISLDETTKKQIILILMEAKKFPASFRGFHGYYRGGLFDHILLTTNYIYQVYKTLSDRVDMKKALLVGIFHDFGKIANYALKKNVVDCKITLSQKELNDIHKEIIKKFHYEGRDFHIEGSIAIIKKYIENNTKYFDAEVYKGIIFHHGSWSKYKPKQMSRLATIIHVADMIASHIFYI